VKEDAAQATHQVIEAAAVIQELAASEAEVLGIVEVAEAKEGNDGTSEAHEGMTDAFNSNIDIVELGSSLDTKTNSPSSSSSSSISSSDEDDVPLSKMYSSINKTPSKTKTSQKPDDIFEPMYPSVQERIIDMQQRRINVCKYLPVDHPLQPLVIEAIQFIPTAAEGGDDPVGADLASGSKLSSKPNSPIIQNTYNAECNALNSFYYF